MLNIFSIMLLMEVDLMNIKKENRRERENVKNNLKFLRERENWSVQELSEISGICSKILLDIEAGEDFELPVLFTLCGIYHIKPHSVFLSMESGLF